MNDEFTTMFVRQRYTPVLLAVFVFLINSTGEAEDFGTKASQADSTARPDVTVPVSIIEALEKQAAAMREIYVQFSETRLGTNMVGGRRTTEHRFYADGRSFRDQSEKLAQVGESAAHILDVSFDGEHLFVGAHTGTKLIPAMLQKQSIIDESDPNFSKKGWEVNYLEAAGFYFPQRVSELVDFYSIEPLVLRYSKQAESMAISSNRSDVAVTCRVPDNVVIAARKMDMDKYEAYLRKTYQASPEMVTNELTVYEHLRDLPPIRVVTLTLDGTHGYAVSEHREMTSDGRLILSIHCSDWKHHKEKDIWLPGTCSAFYYANEFGFTAFANTPIWTNLLSLKHVEFRAHGDTVFSLDRDPFYKQPGVAVADHTLPEASTQILHQVVFTVGGDGTLLRASADSVIPELRNSRFRLVMLAILMVPLVAVFWLKVGRTKRT
jgi:hypothetical protein